MIIVYAHYSKKGHCGHILKTVKEVLNEQKLKYELWDLYKDRFDPILTDDRVVDAKIKAMQKKITRENSFIFIYPTWWFNVPAILKGFYDRVLTRKFAFEYVNRMPQGLLKGKRALVFTTAGGPEIYHGVLKGNRSLKVTTSDTLEFCGIKTKSRLIGNCVHLDEKKKARISSLVRSDLNKFKN